jgi:PTH1 family peptidyl-tRNA hydrolase
MSASSGFRLIVGLGNPGKEYHDTRHNVGFMVLDGLMRGRAEWRGEAAWNALIASWDGAVFCKPQTFMNLSGRSVAGIAKFFKIPVEAILVVSDDMALPLGKLRIRPGGSAGGHNGLKSIFESLGTDQVARLRVGIGACRESEASGYVLGRFSAGEAQAVGEVLTRAREAVLCAKSDGLTKAMNAFN